MWMFILLIVAAVVAVSVVLRFFRDMSRPTLTEPLSQVAGLYSAFMLLYIALAGWRFKDWLYGGRGGSACVDTGIPAFSSGGDGWRAAPGGSLSTSGDIQACALHPSTAQWALSLLTQLPGLLLWGAVLVMILRLIRHAVQDGPFTPRAAALMRQLGWVVVVGAVVAGALSQLGSSLLTDQLLAHNPLPYDVGTIVTNVLFLGGLKALFPVPALAGAALISFGRITRVGAVMDEELKATV